MRFICCTWFVNLGIILADYATKKDFNFKDERVTIILGFISLVIWAIWVTDKLLTKEKP